MYQTMNSMAIFIRGHYCKSTFENVRSVIVIIPFGSIKESHREYAAYNERLVPFLP